jgi:hypothetical protein
MHLKQGYVRFYEGCQIGEKKLYLSGFFCGIDEGI